MRMPMPMLKKNLYFGTPHHIKCLLEGYGGAHRRNTLVGTPCSERFWSVFVGFSWFWSVLDGLGEAYKAKQ